MSLSWFFRLILFAISYFNQWILHEKVCWKKVYIYILFKLKFDLLVNVKMEGLDWFCSKKVLKVSPFVKKKQTGHRVMFLFHYFLPSFHSVTKDKADGKNLRTLWNASREKQCPVPPVCPATFPENSLHIYSLRGENNSPRATFNVTLVGSNFISANQKYMSKISPSAL